MAASNTHGLALGAQFRATLVDWIVASSHGRALGLIMRLRRANTDAMRADTAQ